LIRDPAQTCNYINLALFIRASVEDEYPGWLAATVSLFKAMAAPPAYMPIPGPYLRRLPILPPSSHANSEQRARHRGFLIRWKLKFCRLPPVMRTQFFAAVTTWFSQMETPIEFTARGSLVAYYARDEIYRSCRDSQSVTMAVCVNEYLVMACSLWHEEERDGRFWLFADFLFGWVKKLKPEELAGDTSEALGFFQAMLPLRAAL